MPSLLDRHFSNYYLEDHMSLIKLAMRTGKAIRGLFSAVEADVKNSRNATKKAIQGAYEGAKNGDLGAAYLKQRKMNSDLGKKIRKLRDQIKGHESEIKSHKLKEKIIGGVGLGTTIGAGSLAFRHKKNVEKL